MKDPTLSIIVPTPGGERPLMRCLLSLNGQLRDGDEVLIIGDTFDGSLADVEQAVETVREQLRYPIRYLPFNAGYHAWGHPQMNYGMGEAKGDYLLFQDDDDVFTQNALSTVRASIAALPEPRPLLFKFFTAWRVAIWDLPHVEQGHVTGQGFVVPNDKNRLGKWGDEYEGDFLFIRDTVKLWGGESKIIWNDTLIGIARPDEYIKGISYSPVVSLEDAEIMRQIRNSGREWMFDKSLITPEQQRKWWENRDPDKLKAWIIYLPESDNPIGFGMLTNRDGFWFVTLVVLSQHRNQGFGTLIYQMLVQLAPPGWIWAAIREDNLASIRAAEKAGWLDLSEHTWGVRPAQIRLYGTKV